jgi:hypothetical protein
LRISRKANLREDPGEVLGIVSDEYEVVENRDAPRFVDALSARNFTSRPPAACGAVGASGAWPGCPSTSSSAAIGRRLMSTWQTASNPGSASMT